jgi:hypothetical protein
MFKAIYQAWRSVSCCKIEAKTKLKLAGPTQYDHAWASVAGSGCGADGARGESNGVPFYFPVLPKPPSPR